MTGTRQRRQRVIFGPGSRVELRRIGEILRRETVGGLLLVAATAVALAWANSPWAGTYNRLLDLMVGPHLLHLRLNLDTWAADGLLAIFFFVAGLEVKREFVAGDLRELRRAVVPVAAAVGGVLVPAAIYLAVVTVAGHEGQATRGWAIPSATDIAFALAILAVAGRFLPADLRTFLLTLAVVDDLLAIVIIAVAYTSHVWAWPALAALAPLAAFAVLVQRRVRRWWLLLPLAAATWVLVHAAGFNATIAGVLLAFTVPVVRSEQAGGPEAGPGLAEHFEHRLRPLSAGVAVPLFAFFSAGANLRGPGGIGRALTDPAALGVVAGLVIGKPIGVGGTTWLVARITHSHPRPGIARTDLIGLALLAGVGFTVSLLIGELAFGADSSRYDHVKVAVFIGSLTAALLGSAVLRVRNRAYRRHHHGQEQRKRSQKAPEHR